MPMRCDAEPARGDVCSQCSREHRAVLTGWRIVGVCAAAIGAGSLILWYLMSAAADEWKFDRNRGPYKGSRNNTPDEETGEYRPQRIPWRSGESSW
jgi:hypothetical protein